MTGSVIYRHNHPPVDPAELGWQFVLTLEQCAVDGIGLIPEVRIAVAAPNRRGEPRQRQERLGQRSVTREEAIDSFKSRRNVGTGRVAIEARVKRVVHLS
jgi:hypothetical protein